LAFAFVAITSASHQDRWSEDPGAWSQDNEANDAANKGPVSLINTEAKVEDEERTFYQTIYEQVELLEEQLKEHAGIPVTGTHELTKNFALAFEKVAAAHATGLTEEELLEARGACRYCTDMGCKDPGGMNLNPLDLLKNVVGAPLVDGVGSVIASTEKSFTTKEANGRKLQGDRGKKAGTWSTGSDEECDHNVGDTAKGWMFGFGSGCHTRCGACCKGNCCQPGTPPTPGGNPSTAARS